VPAATASQQKSGRHCNKREKTPSTPTGTVVETSEDLPVTSHLQGHVGRRGLVLGGCTTAFATTVGLASPEVSLAFDNPQDLGDGFQVFYGLASSASSYGGYGGNENTGFSQYRYFYQIPQGFQSTTVGKIDKATKGLDSRWVNPKVKGELVFGVTLAGYSVLPTLRSEVLDNLSLSDFDLQDRLTQAERKEDSLKMVNDQEYYMYEVEGPISVTLASVTTYAGRFFGCFVETTPEAFNADPAKYRRLVDSFETIDRDNAELEGKLTMLANS